MPLYLLVGRVDDTNKHGTGAFSRELAAKGYQVEVVGSDGAKVTLDAAQILDRKDIMVAVKVNGNPLGSRTFLCGWSAPDCKAATWSERSPTSTSCCPEIDPAFCRASPEGSDRVATPSPTRSES